MSNLTLRVFLSQITRRINELCKVKQAHPLHWRINCIRILIIMIVSESGDESNVIYNWGPQKCRSQKRVREAKSLGNSNLTDSPRHDL